MALFKYIFITVFALALYSPASMGLKLNRTLIFLNFNL